TLTVQRLQILVNGCAVGDFSIREAGPIECRIPWQAIESAAALAITFRHPDAARPREICGTPDDRPIALAFERLVLYRPTAHRAAAAAPVPLDRLMLRFESLGENCEFGLAQRRCGADPLGLLRFASAPLPALLAALRGRFAGVGDWDRIEVRVSENGREYLVFDRRYRFLYHPWVLVGEGSAEAIRRREARQLPLLRRKLIEDLEAGRKIFVYHGMAPLSEAQARLLSDAMRAYGPTTLLWVELCDREHPAGTVEAAGEGLLKGYIDRFAPGENAHDLSLAGWIALCRKAWALRSRGIETHSQRDAPYP
ncbi:MAG TPA: hypothetical protein VF007_10515, partial [Stellaceae bacterium]